MAIPSPVRAERVRGVVFDLDGTLVDGYDGIATAVNAARLAFSLHPLSAADVRGRVGHGLIHLMEDVVGRDRAIEATEIFRRTYDRVCEDETRAVPGLAAALAGLAARGLRMSVASNKPAAFSARILGRLGVMSRFDAIEGPETAGRLKPDPAMIEACLRAMRVPHGEALYVGDMVLDAEAGARAGVDTVLVSGGSSSDEELLATGCPVVGTLSDLLAVIP
jgi:phosphoglycolate phosphatase